MPPDALIQPANDNLRLRGLARLSAGRRQRRGLRPLVRDQRPPTQTPLKAIAPTLSQATTTPLKSLPNPASKTTKNSASILPEILALLCLGAIAGFGYWTLAALDSPMMRADWLALGSLVPVLLTTFFKSRLCLCLSIFSLGLWLWFSLGSPSLGQSYYPIIPLAFAMLIHSATKLRLGGLLALSCNLAYGWLIVVSLQSQLSVSAALTIGMIFAAAQYRMGKAYADERRFGADFHIRTGWVMAIIALFMVQLLWQSVPTVEATLPSAWWIGLITAILVIFSSSLIRFRHDRLSFFGVLTITALSLILPLIFVRPDLVTTAFDRVPGIAAIPAFSILIGTLILASAIGLVINGLRRGRFMDTLLGAIVVMAQTLWLTKPGLMNFDLALIGVLSLISTLAIGGLIAGATPDQA